MLRRLIKSQRCLSENLSVQNALDVGILKADFIQQSPIYAGVVYKSWADLWNRSADKTWAGETPERKVQIGGAKGRTIERTSATAIFESLTRRVGWSLKHGQANSLDEAYVFLCFIRGIINYLAARVK